MTMSGPVLTKKEQKKSLSGMKKRKKVQKNVLAAPSIVKISTPLVDQTHIPKIQDSLKLLLPNARLTKDNKLETTNSCNQNNNESSLEANLKRKQLFLGINSISRGISNGTVASIIFADDINPKLLIKHLTVLCFQKNIPFIYMENFRKLTKELLGFSCVALGFRKELTFFSPISALITSAVEFQNGNSTKQEAVENIETILEEDIEEKAKPCEKEQITFTYLYRDSVKKRVFTPNIDGANNEQNNSESFISLGTEDEEKNTFPTKFEKKVSDGKAFTFDKGVFIRKNPRKEIKNGKFPFEYSATNIIKMGANPERERNKNKKFKKRRNF